MKIAGMTVFFNLFLISVVNIGSCVSATEGGKDLNATNIGDDRWTLVDSSGKVLNDDDELTFVPVTDADNRDRSNDDSSILVPSVWSDAGAKRMLKSADIGMVEGTSVDLSGRGFNDVDGSAFDGLTSVEYLNLSNNYLQIRDPASVFWKMRSLKALNLSGTDLFFGPKAFFAFSNLTTLDISNNPRIQKLDDADLFGLISQSSIRIGRDHKIRQIKCNVFSGTASWESEGPPATGGGSENNYATNSSEDEYSVTGEHRIDLDGVDLSLINGETFEILRNVLSLTLRRDNITDTNVLTKFPSTVKALYMSENFITIIRAHAFGLLERLDLLDLSYNRISTIEATAFETNAKLRKLHLEHNEISYLEVKAFVGLSALESLWLTANKLKKIAAQVFDLPAMTLLDLSYNNITIIELGALKSRGRFFLDISSNLITKLENCVFSGLKKSKNCSIKIRDTPIEFIGGGIFEKMCNESAVRNN